MIEWMDYAAKNSILKSYAGFKILITRLNGRFRAIDKQYKKDLMHMYCTKADKLRKRRLLGIKFYYPRMDKFSGIIRELATLDDYQLAYYDRITKNTRAIYIA